MDVSSVVLVTASVAMPDMTKERIRKNMNPADKIIGSGPRTSLNCASRPVMMEPTRHTPTMIMPAMKRLRSLMGRCGWVVRTWWNEENCMIW